MRVIARGFQDEPRTVLAVLCSATHVHLTDEEGNPLIGFPLSCIYEFDERRFQDLEAAYHLGHKDELARLWKETPHAPRRSVKLADLARMDSDERARVLAEIIEEGMKPRLARPSVHPPQEGPGQ